MKKIMMTLAATAVTALVGTQAHAISTFPVTDFKFTGHTAVYNTTLGTYAAPGYVPIIGDKIWSIGRLTGTVNPSTGIPYPLAGGEEYSYYVGGLRVAGIPIPGLQFDLGHDPASPVSVGGVGKAFVVVWKDPAPDVAFPGGPSIAANGWPAAPYPTADPLGTIINDGTPWLTAILEGAPTWAAGTVYKATITSFGPPIVGSDVAYLHLDTLTVPAAWGGPITGSFNSQVISNYYGVGNSGLTRDAQSLNTLQPPGLGGWYNRDNDPVTAAVIPEPSTLLLLGAGLIGIGAFARRKKGSI